jgi:hypothetical protein
MAFASVKRSAERGFAGSAMIGSLNRVRKFAAMLQTLK